MWHDDHQMCVLSCTALRSAGRSARAVAHWVVVGGKDPAAAGRRRRPDPGRGGGVRPPPPAELAEDAGVGVVFTQQYAGCGGTAAAGAPSRITVPVSARQGAGLPHPGGATSTRCNQTSWSSATRRKVGRPSPASGADVDVDVPGPVCMVPRGLSTRVCCIAHRSSSSPARVTEPVLDVTVVIALEVVIPLPEKCRPPEIWREF